jgi:hypothetical protein
MTIRKAKLSDTQARVIGGASLMGDSYTVYNIGRSSRATFRKLFDLGLIDQPWAGSRLTLEGVNVRTSLKTDLLQRVFPISDVVSRNAYKIQPVENAADDTIATPIQDVTLSTEWHVFTDGKWRNYSYAGMPVNIYEDGKWYPIEYRHFADECKNDCVPETFAITTMRIHGDENIHRTGCADIRRSQIKHGIWADEPWDMTVASLRDYAEQYWGDICTDYGPWGSEEWLAELKDHSTYGKWHACVPNIPEGKWL